MHGDGLCKGTFPHGASAVTDAGAKGSLLRGHGSHACLPKGVHHQGYQILCLCQRQLWQTGCLRPAQDMGHPLADTDMTGDALITGSHKVQEC